MKIGDRVMAILRAKDGIVKSFGEGIYAGDFPLPVGTAGFMSDDFVGYPNPRIDLDDGKIVWGCECYWGCAVKLKNQFATFKFKHVDIDQFRAEHAGKEAKND